MSLGAFPKTSSIFRAGFSDGRQKVVAVDNALAGHHTVTPVTGIANVAAKQARARALIAACDTYLGTDGSREQAVLLLRAEARADEQVLDPLADSVNAADAMARFLVVAKAQDMQVNLLRKRRLTEHVADMDQWVMSALMAVRASAPDMAAVSATTSTCSGAFGMVTASPALVRNILTEILADVEAGEVDVVEALGSPMTAFTDRNDPIQGYDVHHNLNAPLGTTERVASLAHDLTHVSVSMIFQNTSLYLAFDAGASDQDILNLSQKRTCQLQELENLMEKDKTFKDDQKMLLRNKVR